MIILLCHVLVLLLILLLLLLLLFFSSIIGRDIDGFKYHVFEFIYAMPLIAVVNSLLKVIIIKPCKDYM